MEDVCETTERFVKWKEKAHGKFGGKFDYSDVIYVDAWKHVKIICPLHGATFQSPTSHLNSKHGCGQCAKLPGARSRKSSLLVRAAEFVEKSNKRHNYAYDYTKVEYVSSTTNVTITCKEHGDFQQLPSNHVAGAKCPQCALIGRTKPFDIFVKEANDVHRGIYKYVEETYINDSSKVEIICSKHGSFFQTPNSHVGKGQGCPECGNLKKGEPRYGQRLTQEQALVKCLEIHGDKYDYSKMVYDGNRKPITIICRDHGEFTQIFNDHTAHETNCPRCAVVESKEQKSVRLFVESIYGGDVLTNDRDILPSGKELDIVIPEFKLAIEYCGLRYHVEGPNRGRSYHRDKYINAKDMGLQLLTIYSDEWKDKRSIVESIIRNKLQLNSDKIYARKCEVKQLTTAEANVFYEDNHIQGRTTSLVLSLGLVYEGQLVAAMSLGKHSWNGVDITLKRFCTKNHLNVVGAGSKLFKHISEGYDTIKTWSDNRWSDGKLYDVLGFIRDGVIPPRPDYVWDVGRLHRIPNQQMQKRKVGCPEEVKLSDFLLQKGYKQIWDCGKIRWIWKRGQ